MQHPRGAWAGLGGIAILILCGALLLRYLHSYEATDDAEVEAHISQVSARVSGSVIRVLVEENQPVKAGEALAELDDGDYQVALARAEAELSQAEAQLAAGSPQIAITATQNETAIASSSGGVSDVRAALSASQREEESALARLADAQAQNTNAQIALERARRLAAAQAVPLAQLDERTAAARSASAAVKGARAQVEAAKKGIDEQRARLESAQSRLRESLANTPHQLDAQMANVNGRAAGVKAARASLKQARLNLSYTKIVAPFDGIVGRRSVEPGEHVQPGQPLFAVVAIGAPWVTANFKETQLGHIRPGQRARIDVDAFGMRLSGTVESVGAATGSRFSLLPPENATGNYVKIVQRVPVRIRLDEPPDTLERLRPGLSVEPKIWIR